MDKTTNTKTQSGLNDAILSVRERERRQRRAFYADDSDAVIHLVHVRGEMRQWKYEIGTMVPKHHDNLSYLPKFQLPKSL